MNFGNCTLALKQIKCICNNGYLGNICQYGKNESSFLFSEFYNYIDQLLTNKTTLYTFNFTSTDYNKFDDLNALINQDPQTFANISLSLNIADLTSNLIN